MGRVATPLQQVRLGLQANWRQFALLVVVNAFVGAMVGLERVIVPLLAEQDFGLSSRSFIFSFIISFGVVKALANLFAGRASDRIGRKAILASGWLVGLPVPFLIMWAPSWNWVVFANVLLGINQGLCWSTTVIMKIDLVGPSRRGLAMGLNECAGYVAVSLAALASGYIAATYALRPQPFYLAVAFVIAGLLLSVFLVKETRGHAQQEAYMRNAQTAPPAGLESTAYPLGNHDSSTTPAQPSFARILLVTSWTDRALFSVSHAGMINNLNDGMAWGLFPIFFAAAGLGIGEIGLLAAIYPGVWGLTQLATGMLSDRVGRKWMIASGMWVQALAILLMVLVRGFTPWAAWAALLGLGTALVYPTLLAAVGDVAHPDWRASAVGVYRLWRDGGYALGAILAGALADFFDIAKAIAIVGGITFISGMVVARFMYETLPARRTQKPAWQADMTQV
ncbi:MAG: MFS transporter [Dehalococcoidia bacterium]|nr:MFS transporter [Dehalococcoidia bacterium]